MTREDLKEVISRVIERMSDEQQCTPTPGCIYSDAPQCGDNSCDVTTYYAVGEEG